MAFSRWTYAPGCGDIAIDSAEPEKVKSLCTFGVA